MKTNHKWLTTALVILLLSAMGSQTILATQGEIDQVQDEIKDLEEQKKDAQEQVDSLSNTTNSLEGDLAELNNSLSRATEELNQTEEQLAAAKQSLEETRAALETAKETEQQQYEAMKKRIQFMYETNMDNMFEILMNADSFADFLNKSEYIVSIHAYDRKMLEEYQNTRAEIAANEQKLIEEETALASLQSQQESKQQELEALVSSTSEKLQAARNQLASAQADVAAYEAELEKQRAYEEELEAQKAAEDAARLEEIRQQEEENTGEIIISNDASDIALLAALIQCEADGESYEGKLAVGSVVMNRVRSSYFPNTVAGVIYQSGQFSPVASGRFATVLAKGANSTCVQAATEVLGGNITLNCLYFRRNNGLIQGIVIGNHVFY